MIQVYPCMHQQRKKKSVPKKCEVLITQKNNQRVREHREANNTSNNTNLYILIKLLYRKCLQIHYELKIKANKSCRMRIRSRSQKLFTH